MFDLPMLFNWHTGFLFPLYSTGGPRQHEDNDGGMVFYNREGFLAIQEAITQAYIKSFTDDTVPTIKMQRYPYPKYIFDILLEGLEAIVPFVIMLSFVYPAINTVKFIATEKEKQLKEAMKIMGLPNWLHWMGWFVKSMTFMTISISMIVCLLKVMYCHRPSIYAQNVEIFHFVIVADNLDGRLAGVRIHAQQLDHHMAVYVCVQHIDDHVLLHAQRFLFEGEFSCRSSWLGVVHSLRTILVYPTKLRKSNVCVENPNLPVIEHSNGVRISNNFAL